MYKGVLTNLSIKHSGFSYGFLEQVRREQREEEERFLSCTVWVSDALAEDLTWQELWYIVKLLDLHWVRSVNRILVLGNVGGSWTPQPCDVRC